LIEVKVADIKQAFLVRNPALPADSLRVNVASGNRLKELLTCLGKGLKLMHCPAGGTPDSQRIRARTPYQ
jgi:ribonuclease T2